MDGKEFLTALWPDIPQGCGVQMWRLSDKKTFTFGEAKAAAGFAGQHTKDDVYLGVGLSPRTYGGGSQQRVFARDVAGVPGLWADIDVNGGPEGKTGAAPSLKAAESLAHFALEPTLIVNSGYGLQAWWLLEEPWLFMGDTGPSEREQAAHLARAYQALLREQAKKDGYGLDSTHDLARLMRMPGTFNCKGAMAGVKPVGVTVVYEDGPRYELEQFVEVTRDFMAVSMETMRKANGEGIEIELRGDKSQPPMLRIEELIKISDEFREAWSRGKGSPGRPKVKSPNEWDMSIANHLAWSGFDAQEICDAITYHRIRFGDPKQKYMRMDYMTRTIGKALASVDIDDEDEVESVNDAIEELERQSKLVHPDPARTTSLFSQIVKGPEVKRLIQDGTDPDHVQYRLELADGSEVPLGGVDNLIDQTMFRKRFVPVTGILPKRLKIDEWEKSVRALLASAEVNEVDSRSGIVHSWLEGYLDYGLSTDKDAACQAMDPWVDDHAHVFLHAGNLNTWLRRNRGLRFKDTEVHQYLHAAGFERKSVAYTRDDGKRNMRSYWTAPMASVGGMAEAS